MPWERDSRGLNLVFTLSLHLAQLRLYVNRRSQKWPSFQEVSVQLREGLYWLSNYIDELRSNACAQRCTNISQQPLMDTDSLLLIEN
jgi:hypothetical protein